MKPRLIITVVLVALAIVVCTILFLTAFTVRATECAVVLRWEKPVEKYVGTKEGEAGLHWKSPWPIEKVEKFDGRTHVFSSEFEQAYTQDGYAIIGTVSAGWRIADPVLFREKVGTVEKAREHLSSLVRTYKNAAIGRHPISHLISTDPETLQFDQIEAEMLASVGKEAEETYGITVEFTKIKQLGLPESAAEQVFERMRKEREKEAVAIREKGKAEAKKIRADADSKSAKTLADAEAEAKRLEGEGEAEAAEYYKVFARNEDLAIFLRKLEALKVTLEKRSTVILTTDDEPYVLLKKGWKEKK